MAVEVINDTLSPGWPATQLCDPYHHKLKSDLPVVRAGANLYAKEKSRVLIYALFFCDKALLVACETKNSFHKTAKYNPLRVGERFFSSSSSKVAQKLVKPPTLCAPHSPFIYMIKLCFHSQENVVKLCSKWGKRSRWEFAAAVAVVRKSPFNKRFANILRRIIFISFLFARHFAFALTLIFVMWSPGCCV